MMAPRWTMSRCGGDLRGTGARLLLRGNRSPRANRRLASRLSVTGDWRKKTGATDAPVFQLTEFPAQSKLRFTVRAQVRGSPGEKLDVPADAE
jgi:hypothetical protein